MIVSVNVPSMGHIDLFKNVLYSIGPCAKKKIANSLVITTQKSKCERTINMIPLTLVIK